MPAPIFAFGLRCVRCRDMLSTRRHMLLRWSVGGRGSHQSHCQILFSRQQPANASGFSWPRHLQPARQGVPSSVLCPPSFTLNPPCPSPTLNAALAITLCQRGVCAMLPRQWQNNWIDKGTENEKETAASKRKLMNRKEQLNRREIAQN